MPTRLRSGREDAPVGEHRRESPRTLARPEPQDARADRSTDRVEHVAERGARRIERARHRIELECRERRVDPNDLSVPPGSP